MPAVARDGKNIPIREGLPSSYRMRADAHYIDQLDAPPVSSIQMLSPETIEAGPDTAAPPALLESIKRHGLLEPLLVHKRDRRYHLVAGRKRLAAARTLGLREVPAVVRRLTDEEVRSLAVVAQASTAATPAQSPDASAIDESGLASALASVLSCTNLLSDGVPPLTRHVAVEMIRAETQRAICALRTAHLLVNGVSDVRRAVRPQHIVDGIVEAIAADVRLRGSRVATRVDVGEGVTLRADEQQLVSALSAVVLTLSAGLHDVHGARLDLNITSDVVGRVVVTIVQESVILPNAYLTAATAQQPEVDRAVASLVALRRLAEAYEGTFAIDRLAHGTQVSITLPYST
jgi:hypothetical protein